jgi:phospholipid transport system substrate-binding protein
MLDAAGGRVCLLLIMSAALFAAPAVSGRAQSEDSVRTFVERVNEASTALLSSDSEADARRRCRRLLAWAFDVPAMARYALGDFWNTIVTAERKAFVVAFEEAVVSGYVRRVTANRGASLVFIGARPQQDGNRLAATRLIHPEKQDQTWIWRLKPDGESWRVIDVTVEGRSALHAERQEYARILEANNRDINAVIAFIRSRETR